MKAALVTAPGATPVYADFDEPVVTEGAVRVAVVASALSHVTKSRASGKHYSASGQLPLVPGIDGVGTLDDGSRVYFIMPEAPCGGMAEVCVVKRQHCIALPPELDMVTAAAMAIPGMSSWAALVERAKLLRGETVLINGATGVSGRLAVQIAKYLGAAKVIATGRNAASLESLGHRCRRDHQSRAGKSGARQRAPGAVQGWRGYRSRLSVGAERGGLAGGRHGRRAGGGADPLCPHRLRQRADHHLAECGLALVADRVDGQRHGQHSAAAHAGRLAAAVRRRRAGRLCDCDAGAALVASGAALGQ